MNKYLLLLLSCLFSTSVFADYDKCKWADATVEFVGSNWSLTPNNFYAKEGDKICVKFTSVDNRKSLRIQGMPIFLHASPNKSDEASVVIRKPGTFTVICGGCEKTAQIVVQPKSEFEATQKKLDLYDSYQRRNPHLYNERNPASPR